MLEENGVSKCNCIATNFLRLRLFLILEFLVRNSSKLNIIETKEIATCGILYFCLIFMVNVFDARA